MFVDINRGNEQLVINMGIDLPRMPCALVSLDAQDIMGTHIVNVGGDLKKTNLDVNGTPIGAEVNMFLG